MSATLVGLAAHWGVGSIAATGVVISSTVCRIQDANIDKGSELAELMDENGETNGLSFYNKMVTVDVTVIPSDASVKATAAVNMYSLTADPGTVITFTADTATQTTSPLIASNSGKFIVLSSKNVRTNKGYSTVQFTCKTWTAHDVTVATT